MEKAFDQSSDLGSFIASIRECMPDTATVREALSFAQLAMENRSLTGKMKRVHGSLWSGASILAGSTLTGAHEMRNLAGRIFSDCDNATTGQILELTLHAVSLRLDDRPSERMLCVDLGMMSAGLKVIGIEDVLPAWESDDPRACVISPRPMRVWIAGHVGRVCDLLRRQVGTFATWSPVDLECALLALRMNYCVFASTTDGELGGDAELIEDFEENGVPVWNALQRALELPPSHLVSGPLLKDKRWHERARQSVRETLEPSATRAVQAAASGSDFVTESASDASELSPILLDGKPALIVCPNPIASGSDRYDREEINRHKVLQLPLPLAPLPKVSSLLKMHCDLLKEFPWGVDVLSAIFDDLYGRAALGVQTFGFPPTLLVGAPGCGKSRLAGRLADVFALPRMDLSLGGRGDSKVLSGTARGWASGRPSDLATFLATRRSASAMVILDELDKSTEGFRTGVGLQSFLLGLLEPETARRLMDAFLKTECDYSGVMWIGTANALSGIQPPLRSRLRILMLQQPSEEHFPVIAEHVLADLAKGWAMERDVLPQLKELELPWERLASARQVRAATEVAVMKWARELRRH